MSSDELIEGHEIVDEVKTGEILGELGSTLPNLQPTIFNEDIRKETNYSSENTEALKLSRGPFEEEPMSISPRGLAVSVKKRDTEEAERLMEVHADTNKYLKKHPELQDFVEELYRDILLNKPSDILGYCEDFFGSPHNKERLKSIKDAARYR